MNIVHDTDPEHTYDVDTHMKRTITQFKTVRIQSIHNIVETHYLHGVHTYKWETHMKRIMKHIAEL